MFYLYSMTTNFGHVKNRQTLNRKNFELGRTYYYAVLNIDG